MSTKTPTSGLYGFVVKDKTVTAYRGASVIIPCTGGLSEDVTYVAWKKDDDVYGLLRKGSLTPKEKRNFATSHSRRLRLPDAQSEAERDDYSIHIRPVIKRDEGVYRCILGNFNDKKQNRVIITRLRVVDRERVVYANAGETVTLPCGDVPTASAGGYGVRWTKDAFLIAGQKELTIENVTRIDGGTYVCVFEKDTGDDVVGDRYVSTTYLLVQGHSSITVAAGSTVTLPCEIAGDDVWGSANWLFTPITNDQKGKPYNVGAVHRAGIPSGGGRLAFPLTLQNVQRTSAAGLYTCATLEPLVKSIDRSTESRDQRYIASVRVNVA